LNIFEYALNIPTKKYDQFGLAVTTVDAYCRRYPKSCRELFPKRKVPIPIPPPFVSTETDEPDGPTEVTPKPENSLPDGNEWKETIEQPDNKSRECQPEPDLCVLACIKCFTRQGAWYEKIYACPLCFACVAFGGV
jgi:hypothetical protein